MKVLQIIHRLQNRGAETFASQLSNHLIALGHDIKIVSLYEGFAKLPFVGKIECLNALPLKKNIDFNTWRKLAAVIKEYQPDIVQANSGDTLKYVVFSKLIFKWKVPIVSRNASEVGKYFNSTGQKYFNRLLYKNVQKIISVSEASKTDIINHFSFLSGKTEVIPVGLERKEDIEEVKLLPGNKKHIVHVGGFSFEKNHSGLIRIFEGVIKKNENVHLHLIGDGPLKKMIGEMVQKKGLNSNITFYGFVNNPLSYIKAADIFVLPSIIEGLPSVLLEAMYCKRPIVAYDVGGISEIITPNTGKLINKNNEGSFIEAVLKSIINPDSAQILTAYGLVEKKFMIDQIAERFIKEYEDIVKGD